jgi:hypothetical protein
LLAAFIPALLMLATFGLQRLESGLDDDTVSASDVAAFLEQAKARAPEEVQQPVGQPDWRSIPAIPVRESASLPNRLVMQHRANPEFRQTRYVNRV